MSLVFKTKFRVRGKVYLSCKCKGHALCLGHPNNSSVDKCKVCATPLESQQVKKIFDQNIQAMVVEIQRVMCREVTYNVDYVLDLVDLWLMVILNVDGFFNKKQIENLKQIFYNAVQAHTLLVANT